MILGFAFQVAALRLGSFGLVQPPIAAELVIVFGIVAWHDSEATENVIRHKVGHAPGDPLSFCLVARRTCTPR
jgi:hypothetical protein